ncbi:allergen Tha p 1-like [Anticarsia gemmatalis]|uniref:allergen Tha p 1-like n=1 Tax=Anticarsia gemmatalis TaxID=129554 RepID=UPI003F7575F0
MKSIIILCVLGVAAVALAKPHESTYTDKYDHVNVREVLANEKLYEGYYKCIVEKGKCTPDAKELKSHIHEALAEHCAKCTEAQREGTKIVLKFLINHKPQHWKELKEKYDSTGKYAAKYEEELKELSS